MKKHKLYRSSSDKKIFGVCGGLADYTNIDSTFYRLLFIFLAIMGSLGIWAYLIMALVLQYDPDHTVGMRERPRLCRLTRSGKIFGVCAGLSEYFNLDLLVLRIIAVISAIFGLGLIFYIIAAIVMPVREG